MKVELHIEELVLRGIGKGMQREIQAAMERELADLFRAEGGTASLDRQRDLSRLDAGSFQIGSTAGGRAIGARLARSVHRGIVG